MAGLRMPKALTIAPAMSNAAPTIIAQQANFAPVNLELLNEARARLGRPPLPLAQERQAEVVVEASEPPAGNAP